MKVPVVVKEQAKVHQITDPEIQETNLEVDPVTQTVAPQVAVPAAQTAVQVLQVVQVTHL